MIEPRRIQAGSVEARTMAEAVRDLARRHAAGMGDSDRLQLELVAARIEQQGLELARVRCLVMDSVGEDSLAVVNQIIEELHQWALKSTPG